MRDQNVNARAGGHGPKVLQFPIGRSVTQTDSKTGAAAAEGQREDTKSLYDKIASFDFTKKEWSAGATAMLYKHYLVSSLRSQTAKIYTSRSLVLSSEVSSLLRVFCRSSFLSPTGSWFLKQFVIS